MWFYKIGKVEDCREKITKKIEVELHPIKKIRKKKNEKREKRKSL